VTLAELTKILVVALSLGLDVFAVSVGVGMRGTAPGLKLRIGAAFATAEVTMTLAGVGIGQAAGQLIGEGAGYLGFAALVGVGAYMIYEALRGTHEGGGFDLSRGWGLFLGALSISLDSLGIGFSILYIGVPLGFSIGCIAVVSILSTTLGLALGKQLGEIAEEYAAVIAGVILILTGLTFAALKFYHIGT
jgi:manganese efflux pump family protein